MKLESIKTYQYVEVGNKNATSFSTKDIHGPFELTLVGVPCEGGGFCPSVSIVSKGQEIFVPMVNVQFFKKLKAAVDAESKGAGAGTKTKTTPKDSQAVA